MELDEELLDWETAGAALVVVAWTVVAGAYVDVAATGAGEVKGQ